MPSPITMLYRMGILAIMMLLSLNQLVTGQSSCSCVNCKKILAGPHAGTYISMGSQENSLNFKFQSFTKFHF